MMEGILFGSLLLAYTSEQAHRMQGELVKKWRVTKRRQAAKMQSTELMAEA